MAVRTAIPYGRNALARELRRVLWTGGAVPTATGVLIALNVMVHLGLPPPTAR
jgi:hypothetical protein